MTSCWCKSTLKGATCTGSCTRMVAGAADLILQGCAVGGCCATLRAVCRRCTVLRAASMKLRALLCHVVCSSQLLHLLPCSVWLLHPLAFS